MKNSMLSIVCVLVCALVLSQSVNGAGQNLGEFKDRELGRRQPTMMQDNEGNLHILTTSGYGVTYTKMNQDGTLAFAPVGIGSGGIIVEDMGLVLCADGKAIAIYSPYDRDNKFVLIDEAGSILDSGVLNHQSHAPFTFQAPDGNPVLWGSESGEPSDPRFNLPKLWAFGEARLYAFWPSKLLGVYQRRGHMLGDSSVYYLIHGAEFQVGSRNVHYDELKVYRFDTWQGKIVDSTTISLVDNENVLELPIPYSGIRIVEDEAGNMLVFASYFAEDTGRPMRVFRLSPDLKLLSPPDIAIKEEAESAELIPVVRGGHSLFCYEKEFTGRFLSVRQLMVTQDTLYHKKLFDCPRSYK